MSEAEAELKSQVAVTFELPGGRTADASFQVGQTVLVLKSYLEGHHDLPMISINLMLDGKLMIDPLCLSDFPAIEKSRKARITVKQRDAGK